MVRCFRISENSKGFSGLHCCLFVKVRAPKKGKNHAAHERRNRDNIIDHYQSQQFFKIFFTGFLTTFFDSLLCLSYGAFLQLSGFPRRKYSVFVLPYVCISLFPISTRSPVLRVIYYVSPTTGGLSDRVKIRKLKLHAGEWRHHISNFHT